MPESISKAQQLCHEQLAAGRSKAWIASEISHQDGNYSRTSVSLYLAGKYPGGVKNIEAAIIRRFDRRICPHDQQEKKVEQCIRIVQRGRPLGFRDAEELWLACQSCPHKPTQGGESK